MDLVKMNSGKSLRQLMAKHKTSRIDMAIVLNCTEATVSALRKEKGIAASKLVSICEFYNITASEYFKLGE